MKVLSIGDYSGDLGVYEAQLKQFMIMHHRGVDVTIQGHFSEEIENLLKSNNIPIIKDKPNNKNDADFIKRLKENTLKNNFNIVHVFGGSNTSNTCIALKKHKAVKIIGYMGSTSVHWHDPSAYKTYLNPRIDAMICNSDGNAIHFKKQLFGKNKRKVHRIYKGYNPDWFSNYEMNDLSDWGIKPDSIVITSVGNRRKVKAMDLFVKAAKLVKNIKELDIHFVLVGDNTDDDFMTQIKNNNPYPENIHLLGYKSDIKEILKRTDIYVQTSLKEGLGRAITESMCLKKPIIVTNAGGCAELVDEGVNGYIATNKSVASIAEKINLLTVSKEKRVEFGENSFQRILNIFNIEITVDQTLALYYSLLKK